MPKGDLNNLPMCQCTDLLICCYVQFTNKTETALLYFPDSTPKVAVRHLMRWIARCAPLLHALEATGYHPCQKSFTCRQLQLVYLHLGEP